MLKGEIIEAKKTQKAKILFETSKFWQGRHFVFLIFGFLSFNDFFIHLVFVWLNFIFLPEN